MKRLTAKSADENKRLDVFVAEKLPALSRSFIQSLCDIGKIKVNGDIEPAKKRLHGGDKVSLEIDLANLKHAPPIELPIIYEDEDCLVINKPPGILTHSKGAYNPEPTVATFIAPKVKGIESDRAGIVHRLDRSTSGVIICAKNQAAQSWLQKQFSTRRVKKTYVAVVAGNVDPSAAIIDMPLERNPKRPQTFRVGSSGKSAVTEYEVLKSNDKYSLLGLKPTTGRTHQLRVHLKYIGHPIVGDVLYGGQSADHLYLHALSLEITLPNKQRQVFKAPVPDYIKTIMS